MELNDQELARMDALMHLRNLNIDPYPAALFPVDKLAEEVKSDWNDDSESMQDITLAGRLMMKRVMGKASFAELLDSSGRIQLYVQRDDICPDDDKSLYNDVFKKHLDIGDFIGVRGFVFRTQMGEITLHIKELTVLAKSLRPLPIVKTKTDKDTGEVTVYDAFRDPELRYRQRYVDLIVNPEVKETFLKRTKMMNALRTYLNDLGALEVDTPVMQPIPGGAAARPFTTHHNALDIPLFLRVSNELYLKRLIVGGFDFVYEFSRNFRNEGMDRTHNPEFTILEFYVAYKDYFWMMDKTEQMLEQVAIAVNGSSTAKVGETIIDFKAPYKRVTIFEAIQEHTGIDISNLGENELRDVCKTLHIPVDNSMGKGKLIDEIFGAKAEKNYIQPTFITDYPVEMSPLTKKHRNKDGLVERFELMINGKEVANAYSELNDPIEQRQRFEDQIKLMERGDDEAMFIDHDFLRALEYGMPPTSGIGFGIDRLAMLLTNQASIQDVLFFPQMRPEKFDE